MFVADSLIVIGLATVSLGTIHEADGAQQRSFWLRNAGTEAVAITQGYTSCGCTTVRFPKDSLIHPGDSAAVTLRFNPRGKGGAFEETATLIYSLQSEKQKIYSLQSKRKTVHLSLTGTCVTSEETLLRQFPVRISDTLRLSADRFDLGIMHIGETKERTVVILHRSEADRREPILITFTPDASTPKGLQHIPYPVKAGSEEITITLDVIIK